LRLFKENLPFVFLHNPFGEAKAAKRVLWWWHDRANGGMGRAKPFGGWLHIFCTKSSYFWSESAPNLLSFAPRLNLSNICS